MFTLITTCTILIKSLIPLSYCKTMYTRCSHSDGFENLLSQFYFMLVLDVCNASAFMDINIAHKNFKELAL